ncbi:MAG: hypothetical protein M3443_08975 [Actinomycetota bacterium]|nr:hypothetical protein [Actinomycetota bacterium]
MRSTVPVAGRDASDDAIEVIIVGVGDEEERGTAFLTVIETLLPARAGPLGSPVTIAEFDYHDDSRKSTVGRNYGSGAGPKGWLTPS